MPDRYVLLGGNVSNSPTPQMMNAAMMELGLDATYEPSSVQAPELRKAFAAIRESGVKGANVTIPHKSSIIRFLDSLEGAAAEIGAVNTLQRDADGYVGYNTDVDGILGPIAERNLAAIRRAVVVGTGGAARAFCKAMSTIGCAEITVLSREPARARGFIESMRAAFPSMSIEFDSDEEGRPWAPEMLFNASPAGARGIPLETRVSMLLAARPIVFDAVYAPVETDLIRRARRLGCQVIYGHEMLLHQGLRSLELWTGRSAPLEAMKSSLFRSLGVSAD